MCLNINGRRKYIPVVEGGSLFKIKNLTYISDFHRSHAIGSVVGAIVNFHLDSFV